MTDSMPVTPGTIAWTAGILDSHGRLGKKSNKDRAKGSHQIVLHVSSTKLELVSRLSQLTGTLEDRKYLPGKQLNWDARGCASHCPDAHIHYESHLPDVSKWAVSGSALAIVLWNTRPYLVSTFQPWDQALSTCLTQVRLTGQGVGAVRASTRRMASLGWPIPQLLEVLLEPAETFPEVSDG